jgi:YesN/AraC family two-component response regulator
MVSSRCIMLVKTELIKLGLHFVVELGVADIMEDITQEQHEQIRKALLQSGLVIIEDKKAVLIEKIKNVIIEMIHYSDETPKMNFSDFLVEKLSYDYTYLSNLFSDNQGITIEKFIIAHKIERVKELIIYDELSLKEIAWNMHYCSVSHLSNQFKMITGFSPTHFKNLKIKRRSPIETICNKKT